MSLSKEDSGLIKFMSAYLGMIAGIVCLIIGLLGLLWLLS